MIKYWNPRRVQRVKARKERRGAAEAQRVRKYAERSRTYSSGDAHKNIRLMLDALGLPLRRKIIARLAKEGALSLSKLVEPFNTLLPSASIQLTILERAGLVESRKQGRLRICSLKPAAFKELAALLQSTDIVKYLD